MNILGNTSGILLSAQQAAEIRARQGQPGADVKSLSEANSIDKSLAGKLEEQKLTNKKLQNDLLGLQVAQEQAQQSKLSDHLISLMSSKQSTSPAAIGYLNSPRTKLTIGAALGITVGFHVSKPTDNEIEAQLGDLSAVDKEAKDRFIKITQDDGNSQLFDTLNLANVTSETPTGLVSTLAGIKLDNKNANKALADATANKFFSSLSARTDKKSKGALIAQAVSNPETAKVLLGNDTIHENTSIAYNEDNTVTYTNQDGVVITKNLDAIAHNAGFDIQEADRKAQLAKSNEAAAKSGLVTEAASKASTAVKESSTPKELTQAVAPVLATGEAVKADAKAAEESNKLPTSESVNQAAKTIAASIKSSSGRLPNNDVTKAAITTVLKKSLNNPKISSVTISKDGTSVSYSDGSEVRTIPLKDITDIGAVHTATVAPTARSGDTERFTANLPDSVRRALGDKRSVTNEEYKSLTEKEKAAINTAAGNYYRFAAKVSKATIEHAENTYKAVTTGLGFETSSSGVVDSKKALDNFEKRSGSFGALKDFTRNLLNRLMNSTVTTDTVAVKAIAQYFGVVRNDMFGATATNGEILLFASMYSGTDKSISDIANALESVVSGLDSQLATIDSETPRTLRTNSRTIQLGIARKKAKTALENLKLLNNFMATDGADYKRRLNKKLARLTHPTKQQAIKASNDVLRDMKSSVPDEATRSSINQLLNGLKAVDKQGNIVSAKPKLTSGK